jgi:hypothetical protein
VLLLASPLPGSGLNTPKNEMEACFQSGACLGKRQKDDLKDVNTSFTSQTICKA